LPHDGDWGQETITQAYLLNDPVLVYPVESPEPVHAHDRPGTAFVSVDRPNVVIETVKVAEGGDGVIVRLYESQRQRGPCTLRTNFPVRQALHTNLLEDDGEPLPIDDAGVHFSIKPYEIITIRLQ
jgi:alpha-mannosidase